MRFDRVLLRLDVIWMAAYVAPNLIYSHQPLHWVPVLIPTLTVHVISSVHHIGALCSSITRECSPAVPLYTLLWSGPPQDPHRAGIIYQVMLRNVILELMPICQCSLTEWWLLPPLLLKDSASLESSFRPSHVTDLLPVNPVSCEILHQVFV